MGKKKQAGNLGKSLISDRFGKRKAASRGTDRENFLHTSELQDGYEWGRLNLQSVTEQSNLDDFLSTAELAGTEFTAEKLNITFVDKNKHSGLLSDEQKLEVEELQEKHRNVLKIPRRPAWNSSTTPEELDREEKDAFLEWRRTLASLQEVDGIELTPYEKNLDFWRQLWRVIERSDVVVQIVDARSPLLFRCEDLEVYVQEVDPSKINLILINKADYLTAAQRDLWYTYFKERGVQVAFWSALEETARQNEEKEKENQEAMDDLKEESEEEEDEDSDDDDEEEEVDISDRLQNQVSTESTERLQADCGVSGEGTDKESVLIDQDKEMDTSTGDDDSKNSQSQHSTNLGAAKTVTMETDLTDTSDVTDGTQGGAIGGACDDCGGVESSSDSEGGGKILNGLELLDLFRALHTGKKCQEGQTTIGMVGYPNVGKSSSINAILRTKKVPVSATPGRTKHFQTLYVEADLMLCDCPGLVFPSFVSTKADLVVNGILPIDQMRDHVPPTSLICQLIPKPVLEETYSINLPEPGEGEDPNRCPTAGELLNVYGYMRGYMTANGLPDCPRTSRYILKDFVNGKLLYCNPPPDVDVETFQPTRTTCTSKKRAQDNGPMSVPNRLDKEFFAKPDPKIHAKGSGNVKNFTRIEGLSQVGGGASESSSTSSPYGSQQSLIVEKPWKKHHNRGKKEKLRKTFHHHDDVGKY